MRNLALRTFASAVAFTSAAAVSAADWEYQVIPGDTLWDVSAKYLASAEQTPRLQEYNGIADPSRLRPGSTVRVPVEWLRNSPAPAEIVELSGSARIRNSDSEPDFAATIGHLLWAGSELETDPRSSATVGFADGSQLRVAAETRIVFDTVSTYSGTGMVDTRLRLLQGRVESRVIPAAGPASRFTIETPPATSTVRGTELRVATDERAHRTTAEVPEGSAEVTSDTQRFELPEGFGMAMEADAPPVEPRPLLPDPRIADLDTQAWRIGQPLEWPEVPGAAGYRLQLTEEAESGAILADELLSGPRGTFPEVPEGRYVLRVRAIDDEGIEGFDAVRPLKLHDRPLPPFVIEPGQADRLNPGRIRFRWTDSATASTYRLQVADNEDFDGLVLDLDAGANSSVRTPQALEDGLYFWRVAGRDGIGREGPFGAPERFEVRTGPPGPKLAQESKTLVRWPAGPPGHQYHVQVSLKEDFNPLIREVTLDQAQMALDDLPRGRFYMRIREIDSDGYTGPYGPAQQIDTACWPCRIGTVAFVVMAILLL